MTAAEWGAAALCARIPDWPARETAAEARGGDYSEMVAVCAGCAVRAECLEFGLAAMDGTGETALYGGRTPNELRRMRRNTRRGAA